MQESSSLHLCLIHETKREGVRRAILKMENEEWNVDCGLWTVDCWTDLWSVYKTV